MIATAGAHPTREQQHQALIDRYHHLDQGSKPQILAKTCGPPHLAKLARGRAVQAAVQSRPAWLILLGALAGCEPKVVTSKGASAAQAECPLVADIASLANAPFGFNGEAVQQGDDEIRKLATLWPPTPRLGKLVRESIASYDRTDAREDPAMGFDAYRTTLRVSEDGDLWCTIQAVEFRGEVAMARARCSWWLGARPHEEREACLLRRYGAIFAGLGMTIEGDEASARVEFPEVLTRMHQARREKLGDAGEPGGEGSDPLSRAERFLNDVFAPVSVGSLPGRGGERVDFEAARTLVDAGALDALRRVLRGPNPEGRAFAAIGLNSLGALSPEDLQAIQALKGSSSIRFKGGCMVTYDSASSFYARLSKYDWMFDRRQPR